MKRIRRSWEIFDGYSKIFLIVFRFFERRSPNGPLQKEEIIRDQRNTVRYTTRWDVKRERRLEEEEGGREKTTSEGKQHVQRSRWRYEITENPRRLRAT